MGNLFENIDHCRACSSKNLIDILDLGIQPLANSLKDSVDASEQKFPLSTVFCPDCALFQNKETVNREMLFDHYVWVTGTSRGAQEHSDAFHKRVREVSRIKKGDLVVEIASNDGTFLKPFLNNGYRVLGIDPAQNIVQMARESGVETLAAYWDVKIANQVVSEYGHPKVIIARNVMPHVSELHEVVKGMYTCMADDGIGVIEFHDAGTILQELHYDSIYHEHLSYFTIRSMANLLENSGFFTFDIDTSPISGGSSVIYFAKEKRKLIQRYLSAVNRENEQFAGDVSSWKDFADRCVMHRDQTRHIMDKFTGQTVVGFGASARSSTYLNYCGLSNAQISAVIDNNPLKQGLYTAGSSIRIVTTEEGLEMGPDLLFILAWNFKDEIIRECQSRGYKGEYFIPFPNTPYLTGNCNPEVTV